MRPSGSSLAAASRSAPTPAWVTACAEQKQLIVIDAATNTVRATVQLDGFGYYPTMIEGAPWVALNREKRTTDRSSGSIRRPTGSTACSSPARHSTAAETSSSQPAPSGYSMLFTAP